jgi:hypothetical protein
MPRELARIITVLMDTKLNLPSMFLELIEENLVKGNFGKVLDFYNNRLKEVEKDAVSNDANK